MTGAIVTLAVVVALLLVLLAWVQAGNERRVQAIIREARQERQAFLELLTQRNAAAERERTTAAEERRSLADRIQHPERVQVQPVADYVAPEDEPDAVELAQVGRIVPEFVHVGTPQE